MEQAEREVRIGEAIAAANVPTLLMVLTQLTGDLRWIEPPFTPTRPRGMDDNDTGGLPEDVIQTVRSAAKDAILDWMRTGKVALPHPSDELLVRMLSVAMGEAVPMDYAPMIANDLFGAANTTFTPAPPKRLAPPPGFKVIVIGAGVSGICAGVRLQQAGIPFVILEKGDRPGGTWRDNRYPAAGVDSPNHLYSFSFAAYDWTKFFCLREELHGYLEHVVDQFHLHDNMRLSTEVRTARYDAKAQGWLVDVVGPDGAETLSANVVISASGIFNPPRLPEIEGLDTFAGESAHTALWPKAVDLKDKRVAVIGTGASAMQTVPAIVDDVAALTIFQRSRHWAAPFAKFQVELSEAMRFLFREVPLYRTWYRIRLSWTFNDRLYSTLQKDPAWPHPERSLNAVNDAHREFFTRYILDELGDRQDLREKVVPTYPPYGKRMLMDNGWFRSVAKPHVNLVEDPIERVEPKGVRTRDGVLHEADVLILATGFDVQRFLSTFELIGRDGRRLRDLWGEDDASAYLGMAIPGFPNFFCLYGPNTQPGHGGSIMFVIEAQMHYVMGMLEQMIDKHIAALEVRPDIHDAYNARIDETHDRMVWTHPGMQTYYRNRAGRVTVNLPYRNVDLWNLTRNASLEDYTAAPASAG